MLARVTTDAALAADMAKSGSVVFAFGDGVAKAFDPDQLRDEKGMWASDGATGALQAAVPELKHFGGETARDRNYDPAHRWLYASTHANPNGSPVTIPGDSKATGIAVKVNPATKHIHFSELTSHIKGAGRRMVDAVISSHPDFTFSVTDWSQVGEDERKGPSFWDKVKEAHPGKFDVEKAFNPDEPRADDGKWTDGGGGQPRQRQPKWELGRPLTQESLEQLDIDTLDQMAFGHKSGDIVTLKPSEINIQYDGDLANPHDKFKAGGMDWARSVDLSEPVDVEIKQDGKFYLGDGHHRWFAAGKTGRTLQAKIEVKAKPIKALLENGIKKYSPDQPRTEDGKWTDVGGGSSDRVGIVASGMQAAKDKRAEWAAQAKNQTIEQIIVAAPANQARLAATGAEIAAATGATFKNPDVKTKNERGLSRFKEKVAQGRAPANVVDIVRGGFAASTPEQARAIVAELAKRFPTIDEGWRMNEYNYFDRAALVRFPDGMIGEVQIMEPRLASAKSDKAGGGGGHAMYVTARSLPEGNPTKVALVQQMKNLYGRAYEALSPSWKAELGSLARTSGKA